MLHSVDIEKINEMAINNGNLHCFKCKKASGVYKIALRRVNTEINGKLIRIYLCPDCYSKSNAQGDRKTANAI